MSSVHGKTPGLGEESSAAAVTGPTSGSRAWKSDGFKSQPDDVLDNVGGQAMSAPSPPPSCEGDDKECRYVPSEEEIKRSMVRTLEWMRKHFGNESRKISDEPGGQSS